jgi:amino acid permease
MYQEIQEDVVDLAPPLVRRKLESRHLTMIAIGKTMIIDS